MLVVLVLTEEEEVLAELILCERRRITLEMFSELAQVADIFLAGGVDGNL
jgi:hypothetical protein